MKRSRITFGQAMIRASWRLIIISALATGAGAWSVVAEHGAYYADGGSRALYLGGVAVEHDAGAPLSLDVWSCDASGVSWRCPDDAAGSISVGRPGVLPYPGAATAYGHGWQPLTPAMQRQVRRVSTVDPGACRYWWPAEDSLMIECAVDGMAVAVTAADPS